MTLESTINKNRYIGNGATTLFPFTFRVWKIDQVLVLVGDGTQEQDVSAQCSVDITATGGTVTFPTAPASGTVVVIRRNMPYTQEDDYINGTRFDAEDIEDRLDQDCAERQDLRLDVGRALKVPDTSDKTPEQVLADIWSTFGNMQALYEAISSRQLADSTTQVRSTYVAPAPVSAGTAIQVVPHTVDGSGLKVWHNGVLCERGAAAQYVDYTSASIKFNYPIAQGDTITSESFVTDE